MLSPRGDTLVKAWLALVKDVPLEKPQDAPEGVRYVGCGPVSPFLNTE